MSFETKQEQVVIKAAWLAEALTGHETIMLRLNRKHGQMSILELPKAIEENIIRIAAAESIKLGACPK